MIVSRPGCLVGPSLSSSIQIEACGPRQMTGSATRGIKVTLDCRNLLPSQEKTFARPRS